MRRDLFFDYKEIIEHRSPCIFFDRDGVIIEDAHYIKHPKDVVLCNGAFELFQSAAIANIPIVIVTNQSGISRGIITWNDYSAVTQRMLRLLQNPTSLKAIYANSCGPDYQANSWRKPSPRMILQASQDLRINLQKSAIIGDRMSVYFVITTQMLAH